MSWRRTALVTALALAALTPAACGGSDDDAPPPAPAATTPAPPPDTPAAAAGCQPLPAETRDSIAGGVLRQSATVGDEGKFIEIPTDQRMAAYDELVALHVDDEQATGTAVLAIGAGGGAVFAVNPTARAVFNWGAAAVDGSPIANWRDRLVMGGLVDAAAACLD